MMIRGTARLMLRRLKHALATRIMVNAVAQRVDSYSDHNRRDIALRYQLICGNN